jgi:hypothetical protein
MPFPVNVGCIERISVHSQWIGFANPSFVSEDLEVIRWQEQFVVNRRVRRANPARDMDDRPDDMEAVAPTPESLERLLLALDKPRLDHPQPEHTKR